MGELPNSILALRVRGSDGSAVFTPPSMGLVGAQVVNRQTGEPVGPPQYSKVPVATEYDVDLLSEPIVWPNNMAGEDGDEGDGILPNGRCETHSWHWQAASRGGSE